MSNPLQEMTEQRDHYKREMKLREEQAQRALRRFEDLKWCMNQYGKETYWEEFQELDKLRELE